MNTPKYIHLSIRLSIGLALSIFALLNTGCESTPEGASDGRAAPITGGIAALPLTTLETMYVARTALVALADGSSKNPEGDAQDVVDALAVFETFSERLGVLERSFNSADSTALWEQLSRMGTLYQIDTSGFSASDLRYFEANQLRDFRRDVNDLNRQVSAYVELYGRLMDAVGEPFSTDILRSNVPALNALTTMSVDLDNGLRQFSERLRQLSQTLQESKFGGRLAS